MITNDQFGRTEYYPGRKHRSLIDRGANGSIAGNDLRLIAHNHPERTISVQGINDHTVSNLVIGTFGATVRTQHGDVVLIFNQYAKGGYANSVHSALQLEDNNVKVYDRPMVLGGAQSLTTKEGYTIPLRFLNGLPHMNLRPFTDEDWKTLPHVTMTREHIWSPHQYDSHI